ncbi:MAG: hypothetical protein VYB96_09830, partial [Pseudomonadota bacterium]|nr:hypothetical protein [Pseudomonadota bacterium]
AKRLHTCQAYAHHNKHNWVKKQNNASSFKDVATAKAATFDGQRGPRLPPSPSLAYCEEFCSLTPVSGFLSHVATL